MQILFGLNLPLSVVGPNKSYRSDENKRAVPSEIPRWGGRRKRPCTIGKANLAYVGMANTMLIFPKVPSKDAVREIQAARRCNPEALRYAGTASLFIFLNLELNGVLYGKKEKFCC
jgi:hypothetical protein